MKPVKISLCVALIFLFASTAGAATSNRPQKTGPVKGAVCNQAQENLDLLAEEMDKVAGQMANGAKTVRPSSSVLTILQGDWKGGTTVSTEEYNRALEAKVAEINANCVEQLQAWQPTTPVKARTPIGKPVEAMPKQEVTRPVTPLADKEYKREDAILVRKSFYVLKDNFRMPEKRIPKGLLREAVGVAIFPGLQKAGLILGGRHGKGILMVRNRNGVWGQPRKATLSGVGIGFQIGYQATDVILVFRTWKSISQISRGKFTLGLDASIAVGPVGRKVEAATDIKLKSEIYSYSRSEGLFAGISFDGASLQVGHDMQAPVQTKDLHEILAKNAQWVRSSASQ